MTATPAWPPRSTPRLFVETPLAPGPIQIDGPQAHYLAGVMRMKAGDPLKLFDDATGEWLAIARDVGRRSVMLDVTDRLHDAGGGARPVALRCADQEGPDRLDDRKGLRAGRRAARARRHPADRSSTSPTPTGCART